jgi:hypothetical protein
LAFKIEFHKLKLFLFADGQIKRAAIGSPLEYPPRLRPSVWQQTKPAWSSFAKLNLYFTLALTLTLSPEEREHSQSDFGFTADCPANPAA